MANLLAIEAILQESLVMFGLLDVGKVMYKGSGEKKENTPAVSRSVFLMKNIMFMCSLFGYTFFDFVQVYSETTVGFVTVLDRLTSVENGCVVFVATL